MYSNEPVYVVKSNFWVYQNDFEYTDGLGISAVKKFGLAQNILGPVKGQGISMNALTFRP